MNLPKLFCENYKEYYQFHKLVFDQLLTQDELVKKAFNEKLETVKNFNELFDYYSSLIDMSGTKTPHDMYNTFYTMSESICPLGKVFQPQPEFDSKGMQITHLQGYKDYRETTTEVQPTNNLNTQELKKELENINITLIGISIILALFLSYGILKKFLFKD